MLTILYSVCRNHAAWLWLAVLIGFPQQGSRAAGPFELTDWLGRDWKNERVRFPVAKPPPAKTALVDQIGRPIPFEVVEGPDGNRAIEFLASLRPFTTSRYRFVTARKQVSSDLKIEQTEDFIRITNQHAGVTVRRRLLGKQGPIGAIRLASGRWAGQSSLKGSDTAIHSYIVRLERSGPVAATVVVDATFASGVQWKLRLSLQARAPSILIQEHWSNWDHPAWSYSFGTELDVTRAYYRVGGGGGLGRVRDDPLNESSGITAFSIFPWLKWWGRPHKGNWFTAYHPGHDDTIVVGALRGDLWFTPEDQREGRRMEPLNIKHEASTLSIRMSETGRVRHWLLASLPRSESIDAAAVGTRTAPPPQQLVIRHGDIPLDWVKDQTLTWRSRPDHQRSRLFLTKRKLKHHSEERQLPDRAQDQLAINELRARRGALVKEYQKNLRIFKPRYPSMVQLKKRIDRIDRQIAKTTVNNRRDQQRLPSIKLRLRRDALFTEYQKNLERFKPRYPPMVQLKKRIDKIDSQIARTRINIHNLHQLIHSYVVTGNRGLGRSLSDEAPKAMQAAVDLFTKQSKLVTFGFAPHHQRATLMFAIHLADFALADSFLSSSAKQRLRAQAAFLSAVVDRADYWDRRRGFNANPNMTTMVESYRGMLACLLQDHPLAKARLEAAKTELFDNQLLKWSDTNGGWLEAPHYAIVSLDQIMSVFVCARNLGLDLQQYEPRLKQVVWWLAKILTPPNPRLEGRRHLPPIGNTYMMEPTGLFGTAAGLWRERDPTFASQMDWMHAQSGCPRRLGVGGHWPGLSPYRTLLNECRKSGRRPVFKSELFPQTGAILRAHFGGRHETRLHLIAGRNHAHYDDDSGSITIWGKGQLIAGDFGYYGRAPASDHSMVDLLGRHIMRVHDFATNAYIDTIQAQKGPWTRTIAMVKDVADPLGPNYFVLNDRIAKRKKGTWRLWVDGIGVKHLADRLRVVGSGTVDTDIFFVGRSLKDVSVEQLTRTSASSGIRGRRLATTQWGLNLQLDAGDPSVGVVIFPRLKDGPTVNFRTEMNGRVVRIETPGGTDRVFLSDKTFSHIDLESDVRFTGRMGFVLRRKGHIVLGLADRGQISASGRRLGSDGPTKVLQLAH